MDHPAGPLDVPYDMTLDTDHRHARIPVDPKELQRVPLRDIQL